MCFGSCRFLSCRHQRIPWSRSPLIFPSNTHHAPVRRNFTAAHEDHVNLLDDDFLTDLSRKYGVSTQALVNRLKNLGYIPD